MYKKFALIGLVIALVAGIALAKAVKVDLLPYPDDPIEPDASGRAVLNYAKGADKTEVQINCRGLMSETEYTVYLYDVENADFYSIGTFTTRKNGTGNFHTKLDGDRSGELPVAVNNPANQTVLLGQ